MATVSRSELLKIHEDVCHASRELMKKKNHDYSGGEDESHPFLNFTRCESMVFAQPNRDSWFALQTRCLDYLLSVAAVG